MAREGCALTRASLCVRGVSSASVLCAAVRCRCRRWFGSDLLCRSAGPRSHRGRGSAVPTTRSRHITRSARSEGLCKHKTWNNTTDGSDTHSAVMGMFSLAMLDAVAVAQFSSARCRFAFLASLPGAPPTAAQLTALLDEMRHQELAVRLNAFRNLPHIAQAMGVNKTRKELIPYVTGAFVASSPLCPRFLVLRGGMPSVVVVLSLTLLSCLCSAARCVYGPASPRARSKLR
jgi:hypothetical protein